MEDRTGQHLGNYRLLSILGKGGFAEVYLGEHMYLKTPAAIKLLHMKVVNQDDLDSFLKEAQTIARLVHPNIVRILEFGLDGETPFLVMDCASNGTLRQRHPRGTQLPVTTIVSYVKQVAGALQYAHEEKVIHRDVKPENMLVGRRDAVLMSDFGIALVTQSSRYQSTQEIMGTAAYMAPEQIQGKARAASDQYSLGVVVYEWLCGDRPFRGSFTELCAQHIYAEVPPLREKVPAVPSAIEQVVKAALAKDPKERFGNIQAFAKALEEASQATIFSPLIFPNALTPKEKAPTEPVMRSTPPVQPVEMAAPPNRMLWPEKIPSLFDEREVPTAVTPSLRPVNQIGQSVVQPGSEPVQPGISRRSIIIGLGAVAAASTAGGILWVTRSQGPSSSQSNPGTERTVGAIKTGVGVDLVSKTITLGILSPYSGPVADPIGIPLANGVKVFFDRVNDNGGVNGFHVKFLEEDTSYDPQTEVTKYNQIHNQVLMIADSLGTPTTFAIKDLADADHMLVSVAALSASIALEKYLILVGTPYRLQVENAFDYIVNSRGVKNPVTGIVYQNDDYGQEGLQGYNEAVSAYNLHDVGKLSYSPTDTTFTAQVSQLKTVGAKYVFLTAIPVATAGIISTAYQLGYNPQWILQSPAFTKGLLAVPALIPLLSKAWVVSQGATWGDTSVPGMAQMLNDIAKYAPAQTPDINFQFGYTQSYITYAILKKAIDNNDITRDGLFNAFQSLSRVNLGGLLSPVTYGTSTNQRVPTRDSVIFQIDPTYPTGLKPLTSDFIGTAAVASQF